MNINNFNLILNYPELFLSIYKESTNKKLYMYKEYFKVGKDFQNIPITDLYKFTFFGVPGDNHCGFHVVLAGLQLFYPEYYNDVVSKEVNNIPSLRNKTIALWLEEPDSENNIEESVKKKRTDALLENSTDWLQDVDLDVIGKHYGITFITIEIQQNNLFISRGGKDDCEKVIYLVNVTNFDHENYLNNYIPNPNPDPNKDPSRLEYTLLYNTRLRYGQGVHYDLLLPKEIDKLGNYNKKEKTIVTDNYKIISQYDHGFSHNNVDMNFSDEKFKIIER